MLHDPKQTRSSGVLLTKAVHIHYFFFVVVVVCQLNIQHGTFGEQLLQTAPLNVCASTACAYMGRNRELVDTLEYMPSVIAGPVCGQSSVRNKD